MEGEQKEYIFAVRCSLPDSVRKDIETVQRDMNLSYSGNYVTEPHITMHLCSMPKENFEDALEALKNEKLNAFEFSLGTVGVKKNSKEGMDFVSIPIDESPQLRATHEYVVRVVNRFRDNEIRRKDRVRRAEGKFDDKTWDRVQAWGNRFVFAHFHPHITLGEFSNSERNSEEVVRELTQRLGHIFGQRIALTELLTGLYFFDEASNSYPAVTLKKLPLMENH